MGIFKGLLDKANLASQRSQLVLEDAKATQEELVRDLEKRVRDLKRKIASCQDIGPDSELSLHVVRQDVDFSDLFERVQSLKKCLLDAETDLAIAKETCTEWFGEIEI
jgi:predicted  nucleic acid-binding Zn-ribbon protein